MFISVCRTPWSEFTIVDGQLRTFTARLGPSGDLRGYEGQTGMASPGFAWYIQGLLAPKLYMQRGITYSFKVEGGNNPHNPEFYHPFLISNTVSTQLAQAYEIIGRIWKKRLIFLMYV